MRRIVVGTSILFLVLRPGAEARAQVADDLDALLNESVSSTASKAAQMSSALPAVMINVTAEDLRRYGIRTLGEAYNFLALGMIAEDPLGDVEVGSRGVLFTNDAGKHVLLLLDGHVTNDQRNGASYHTQSAGIPIELIDHIEIMLGPGSVLYGTNATLGVVNVITKGAKDYQGLHIIAESGFSPPENQAHQPVTPRLDSQYALEMGRAYRVGVGFGRTSQVAGSPVEVTGQLEYYDFTGPQLGWPLIAEGAKNNGPYTPAGFWGGDTRQSYYQKTPSGYLRLLAGNFQLTLHGLFTRSSRPYSRRQEPSRDFDDPQSYVDRAYGAVDLSWTTTVSSSLSLAARIYGDVSRQYEQERVSTFLRCLAGQDKGCIETVSSHGQWFGGELQATFSWLSDRSMTSMLGLEGRVRRVGFENGVRDLVTAAPVASFGRYQLIGTNGALYAQQIYNPIPSVTLNAGARWDLGYQQGQRVSPRAAGAFETWPGATAKVVYSEAFRGPTTEELHLTNRFLVLAAPNLSPEVVRSAEASIQQRLGRQSLLVGIFRSWWNNVVQSQTLSQAELSAGQRAGLLESSVVNVYQFRNLAQIDNYGVNTSYEGGVLGGRLSYGANLTAAYARVSSGGVRRSMPVTPSIYGNARVSYDLGGGRPVVGVVSQVTGRRLVDATQESTIPTSTYAPPTIDLRLTATGRVPRTAALQYRVSFDYVFTTSNPYATGPVGSDITRLILVPVNRATLLFGLQYGF